MNYPRLGYSEAPRSESWANGPGPENTYVLDKTIEHMNSVPYRVSLRWLFYRLLQDGTLAGKNSYNSFKGLIAKARHSGVIHPSAIADEGRASIRLGGHHETVTAWRDEFIKRLKNGFQCVDTMAHHDPYVIVAFEAKAMAAQFEQYANPYDVTLYPFGGDPSIGFKWELSGHVKKRLDKDQNVTLLYFGDLDPKGDQIGETAIRHVRKFLDWQGASAAANVFLSLIDELGGDTAGHGAFNAYRAGLLKSHITQFNIPEQPDKPGHYQWEALEDAQAQELITSALNEFVDLQALATYQQEERDQLGEIAELLDEWVNGA